MLLGALRFAVGSSSCVLWVTWARVPLRLVVLYGLVRVLGIAGVFTGLVVNPIGDKLAGLPSSVRAEG